MRLNAFPNVAFGTSGVRAPVEALSDEAVYAYMVAFLDAVAPEAKRVLLGHDLRPSSPHITAVLIGALHERGIQAIYGGVLPTPAFAAYAAQEKIPAVIVTGSHIPFDRNGIKFYRVGGEITKADEKAMHDAELHIPSQIEIPRLPEINSDVYACYYKRYTEFFSSDALKGLHIGFYQHSSAARDILSDILQGLGAVVTPLDPSDGFVPIDTEAVRPEDIEKAKLWAKAEAFDAIISTDGDADRPLLSDEAGLWLRGDTVGGLTAHNLGITTLITPVSSNTNVEKSGFFQHVIRTRIGSPYVIEAMENASGVVAGYEANGGFLLGSEISKDGRVLAPLPTRDAALPILTLLAAVKQTGKPLSELAQTLPPRFTASNRLQNIPTAMSVKLIESLKANPDHLISLLEPEGQSIHAIDETDGLRVTFGNGSIVHLRPSGNAPELRCYAEADTNHAASALCENALKRVLKTLEENR